MPAAGRWAIRLAALNTAAVVALVILVIAGYQQLAATSTAIQSNRVTMARNECVAQNARHSFTIRTLDQILRRAERHATPVRRAQIIATRAPTVLLVDQLAPYRDCQTVAQHARP